MQKGNVVRGNTVPQGGATRPEVGGVVGGGMLLPDTIQIQEMADIFFENSEQNYLQLNNAELIPGRQTQIKLQNVGLGESLELYITGSFGLRNSHATVPEVVGLAKEFPYNLLSNIQLMFNGKVALVNASGYELLRMMMKRNFQNSFVSSFMSGAVPAENYRIDSRLVSLTVGAGGTLTAGEGLTGFTSITVAANTTVTVTFEMYLDISFVLRKDLPFGLVPMQHNAIYANLTLNTNHLLSATHDTPLRSTSANVSTLTPVITCEPTYNFWGLPANAELYNFFVNNSYVVTTYPKNSITSVGGKALSFNFPLNYWLVSAMFTIRQSGEFLTDVRRTIDQAYLVYNGTIHVDRSAIKTRVARELVATGLIYPYGTLMFDGAQTNHLTGNSANMSKWLNMYQANNPAYYADVITPFTLPGSFDVLLEQLIPNYVTVL